MRTIKILPADSLEEEKESIGQQQQVTMMAMMEMLKWLQIVIKVI